MYKDQVFPIIFYWKPNTVEAVTFLRTLTFKSKVELLKHPVCDLRSVWDAETVRTKFQSTQDMNWSKEEKWIIFSCECECESELVWGEQWDDGELCPGGPTRVQVAQSAICCATVLGWYLTTCSVLTHTHACTHMRTHTHASLRGADEISFSSAFH